MSLFDSVKNKVKEEQEKAAELKDARGSKLASLSVEYMGGYNDQKKAKGKLTFYQRQTEFTNPLLNKKISFIIANTDINSIVIEGEDEVTRRVTVTRLLAVGIFAFALKKKSKDKDGFITLVLADNQEVIFHVGDKAPMELKISLAKAIAQVKQQDHVATPAAGITQIGVADELAKLAQLKKQGFITQVEFDKKKAQLLDT